MKKKKLYAILACALSATCLSACTDDDKNVVFGRYWQQNATVTQSVNETLEYDVAFEASNGADGLGYTFTYSNGKYVTNLKSERLGDKDVYRYTTSFQIDVTYLYPGTTKPEERMSDYVETEIVFSTIGEALRPITSKKKFISHTPVSAAAASAENAYTRYAYEVNTTYSEDGENGTSVVTKDFDNEEKKTVFEEQTFSCGSKYTYLDNEQLLFAIRGISTDTTSAQVNIYSPFVEEKQRVQITFNSDDDLGDDFLLSINGGEAKKEAIPYREVTVGLKETYSGESQTLWIANPSDVSKNTYRNVILKMETPLSYNFGSLIYTLKSITNA